MKNQTEQSPPRLAIEQLGPMLRERRGNRGIRAIAAEIGVSIATLSRVETGKQPDLDTFSKICRWLSIDPSEVLGCGLPVDRNDAGNSAIASGSSVFAHFRAEKTMKPETAQHLGALILAVQRAVGSEPEK